MKRTLILILCAVLSLLPFAAVAEGGPEAPGVTVEDAPAELTTVTPEGLVCETTGGRTACEITDCDPNRLEGQLIIPAEVSFASEDGELVLPVVRIGSWAFEKASRLTGAVIPEGVAEIGSFCFSECTALETVSLPATLTSVGNCAFMLCVSLEEIALPAGLAEVGDNPFCYCTGLERIILLGPDGEETRGHRLLVFLEEEAMLADRGGRLIARLCRVDAADVAVPQGIVTIGSYAFADNGSLREVTLPETVTEMGRFAFYHCLNLRRAAIPETVTVLGRDCFTMCHDDLVIEAAEGSAAWVYAEEHMIDHRDPADAAEPAASAPGTDDDGPFLEETDGG